MATQQYRMDAVRDQRHSWALSPLTPRAVIRYWTARVAVHVQRAGRFVGTSYRRLAYGVAVIMMMLAPLAESRRLRQSRRTQAQPAMKPDTASVWESACGRITPKLSEPSPGRESDCNPVRCAGRRQTKDYGPPCRRATRRCRRCG